MRGLDEKTYSLPGVGRSRYFINARILPPSLPETSCTQVELKPINAKKIHLIYILALGLKVTLSTCLLITQAFWMVGEVELEWEACLEVAWPTLRTPGSRQCFSRVSTSDAFPYPRYEPSHNNVCTVN